MKIGVVGRLVEGERQQLLVAARLLRLVRVEVAVVRDDELEAAPRQHRFRLLVDAAGVADAARQHARQPARRVADAAAGIVENAGDADLADELRRQAAQRGERVGARDDPLVRIEDQAPGRLGQRQRGVARGREVVAPRRSCRRARRGGARSRASHRSSRCRRRRSRRPMRARSRGSARGCAPRRERSSPGRGHSCGRRSHAQARPCSGDETIASC